MGVPAAAPLAACGGVGGTGLLLEVHTLFATYVDEHACSWYVLHMHATLEKKAFSVRLVLGV